MACSRMKRAQSTPHAMTLRQASIEPFGSLHGSNGYGALMEEQRLKNRYTPCSQCPVVGSGTCRLSHRGHHAPGLPVLIRSTWSNAGAFWSPWLLGAQVRAYSSALRATQVSSLHMVARVKAGLLIVR